MMMRLRFLLASLLVLALSVAVYPDEAGTAYKRGVHAESQKQYDAAFQAYKQAYALKPNDPRYATAYLRSRTYAAALHAANGMKLLHQGEELRDDLKLQEALTEFQLAADIDSTNYVAAQGVREASAMLKRQAESGGAAAPPESPLTKLVAEAQGPVDIEPSPNAPITLRITNNADIIYRTIGKLAGINILFDLDYKPQKVTVELNDVMPREALKMVALESKTFWRPISTTAIFVAAEGKRKEFESSVLKTFYLRNASAPTELQDVAGTLKAMVDISKIQVNPTRGSITVRGTPDQLVLAEKLISDADKAKAEVVIDVAVMEVSRNRVNTLGTNVPTSTTVTPVGISTGGTGGAGSSGSGPSINFGSLNGTTFVIPIPSASFTMLMSDSNTKLLQRPQIRAVDSEKASLKIGDRIPIATGSFTPGIGAGGISPLVNTQFQYIDVGVNIDITPQIHADDEVTLKMSLEISSLNGSTSIGGITQPNIGQRRIEHTARLHDGEVNLLGGILEDTETKSLSGYPWLTKIPILKYLFGQENKERLEDEVVFAITPHIVRSQEITDENLRMIDVGTTNTIGLRYQEEKPAKPKESPSSPTKPAATRGGERRQPAAQGNTTPAPKASASSDK
jgi:general secretion pathway protein D